MITLCWIRRDLRLHDHAALSAALASGETHLVFVFDPYILGPLEDKQDRRVTFIYRSLQEIEASLQKKGSSLHVVYGKPEEEIPRLARKLEVDSVFTNRDYEPYAKKRDEKVKKNLEKLGIDFKQFKDTVIFEKHEVVTGSGGTYKVFTPYKNKWIQLFEKQDRMVPEFKCPLKNLAHFQNHKNILEHDWYREIGFTETHLPLVPGTREALRRLKRFQDKMDDYQTMRNYPAKTATSGLSPYLRFGNLSVRDMVRVANDPTWLSEIIWREFFQMILDAYPRVVQGAFRPEFDKIKWREEPQHFKLWCEGKTGFSLIDAAMRCLNETGLMHNRLRMVVASFLCKTLLIDWRLGEQYFAEKLLDFELASNNGGWQWCAGTGADAQPYFRIFNPYTQSEKFDPDHEFTNKWCPDPVPPIVSYEKNRQLCLKMYSEVKSR